MKMIRVLVVDHAVVMRRALSNVLAGDPALEVVGAAANGRIALAKIPQTNPDIVTLEMETPEGDGLQALADIRKAHPELLVIMFSTQMNRGAAALALGANDYVTKPADLANTAVVTQRIQEELIPKIKLLCGRSPNTEGEPKRSTAVVRASVPIRAVFERAARIDIVAIGVSTGGPNALAELMPTFPAGLPVPLVIVQHMPPVFTRLLAERLASRAVLPIAEGTSGSQLVPGRAWIAPGDYHMTVAKDSAIGTLNLNQGPPENSCRPSVDVLFRSVAECYGPHSLAVVLTGMGQDGLRGCEAIRQAGGQVLAQDEASSVVWGMPGLVAQAGLADCVLPLDQMGAEILRRVRKGRSLFE
jgi:two-component system chemotaxis response regulator CheB